MKPLHFLVSISQSEVSDSHEFSKTVFISNCHDLLCKLYQTLIISVFPYYAKILKSVLGVHNFIYIFEY